MLSHADEVPHALVVRLANMVALGDVDAESVEAPEVVGALDAVIAVVGLTLLDAHVVVECSGEAVKEVELDGDPECDADAELDTDRETVVVTVAHADADAD